MEDASRSFQIAVAIAIAAFIQIVPFFSPFRLSSDDVYFLEIFLEGPGAIPAWAEFSAVSQGRIGQYIMTPLNVIGSVLSGETLPRAFIVLLYFSIFVLFSIYISLITRARVTAPLFIVLISMHPLLNAYMPPVTYPLQNTIPFLVILSTRISIVMNRTAKHNLRWVRHVVFLNILFFLSMVISEYAFLFGTSLLAVEHLHDFASYHIHHENNLYRSFIIWVRRPILIIDIGITVTVLIIYISYRIINPSSYDGNTLDAISNISNLVVTTTRHITDGTVFPHLHKLPEVPSIIWAVTTFLGIITAWVIYQSVEQCETLPSPPLVIIVSVVLMVYVTFPISAAAKQQGWCREDGYCVFLDSRTSYLGVGVIVISAISVIYRYIGGDLRGIFRWIIAGSIGITASVNYATNWQNSVDMRLYTEPWHRADLLRCHDDLFPILDEILPKAIDPYQKIMFYPQIDQGKFWRRYIDDTRIPFRRCSSSVKSMAAEREYIKSFTWLVSPPARFAFFGDGNGNGAKLLSVGFSGTEPWGTWSIGHESHIVLPLAQEAPALGTIRLDLSGFVPPQRPSQSVRVSLSSWSPQGAGWIEDSATDVTLTAANPRRVVELVRTRAVASAIRVTLNVAEPVSPQSLGISADQRELGVAVFELTVD